MRSVKAFALAATAALAVAAAMPGHAADLDHTVVEPVPVPATGLPCEAPEVKLFPSVWLGHFTGGYSHYLGPGESTALDWRDEKLCFPSRGTCNHYITEMRRDFHRPEGYYTCLLIR